jgi:D-lactate dehydrogenase
MIDARAIALMRPHVLLINTGRGALIETKALVNALKLHKIGGAGLDVYEEEEGVFFRDRSVEGIDDDMLARLLTFPNVVITSHQAFLTEEALQNIATTTLRNIAEFKLGQKLSNALT